MSSEIVTLYTSANLEDPNPQAFQYYLDYEGSQCLQVAMQNLGIQVDPNLYGLLLRSDEIKWIEPTATLRSQGVTTGCMIVIYPYNTENAQEQQQQQQQPETQEVKLPKIIQASDYEVAPTVYVDDEYRTNPNIYNTLPHDDSDGEFDIHIDTGVADFATNNFGGLRASDFTFIEGETQEPTNEKDKSVNIYTSNGFSTENPKQCQYNLSYSFDDMLAAALRHLGLNKDGRYALLLQYGNDDRRWFGETNYLEDYNPFNGMTLYVFKRERTIRVHSAISHSIPLNLDLTKTVAELVKDVASNFNIENYHGYTLCSIQDKRTQTLNRELSIPQQTKSIRDIYFLRKYLLFSREDLSTLESTKIAYKDAFNEFIKDHINLNPTDAAELIVYQLYAEAEPGKEPDFGSLPDDLSKRLPKSFKDSKKIGSKVKEVAQSIGKLDQFNGCRKFIQKVRRMQGFATKKFDRVKIELKFQGKKTVVEVTVLISPLTITLINPKTGTIEEKISISRIVCMNLLSHQLEIQFSIMRSLGKIGKYILHSSEVPKIKTLIEEYSDVSKQILIQRAQARAAEFGEGVAAIDPRSKISLFTASELDAVEPKSYDYDSKFTGKTLLQYAEQYLNIPHDDDHVVLVKLMKKSYRWITNDMILSLANVQDGMTVYILKNKKPMKILFADGSTKTVLMDITKTIEEIIPMLFEKLSLPEIAGYTLYTIDEKTGEQQPLDTRFSIPEQCTKFDQLVFKRRLYVLSGEVLSSDQAAFTTVCDCKSALLDPKGTVRISEELAIQLAIYYLYANANSPKEVKLIKSIKYDELIPPYIKVDKKFDAKFRKAVEQSEEIEKHRASKLYLGKVRKLQGFGEERFQGLMTEVTRGAVSRPQSCVIAIGPMRIFIFLAANLKEPVYSLTYRFIVSFQSMGHKLVLKFVDSNTSKIISLEIKLREINTALMLLNYNIKIIRDLMLNKQRKQQKEQEDIAKRLRGGFVDENGVVRQAMLDFFVSDDLEKREKLPKVWLETIRTGKEVSETLIPIMKLEPKIEYAILLWILKESYKWVLNDQTLSSANPFRGTILFIIEAFPRIKIYFSMGKTKVMILPIVKKVEELIPIVAKGNGLAHYLGFTLYLPSKDGQPPKPLDTNISIPEQATRYSELEFRRRFSLLQKSELEDPVSLYQAFCDVRELILSGRLALSQDNALELMYYALVADGPTVLTPTTVPSETSFPMYYPKGMKINYKQGKNKIIEFLQSDPIDDKYKAMVKYIQKARSLPQFGCEEFPVILVEEKNGNKVRTNVILFVGPYRVFVTDENKKNELVMIPYKKFVKLETFGNELSMKYCDEDFKASFCNIESESAEEIASLILSFLNIHKQILMNKIQDENEIASSDRVELITVFCQDFENAQPYAYDMRDKGSEVIRKAAEYLGIDPTGQYSALLRISDDEFHWIKDDTILGSLNAFDGVTIHIYYTYMPVQIHTDTFDRQMLINIEKTVEQLIDEIAFKMYVDFPLGYTLYARDEEGEFALDLARTVPEQVLDFDKMTFRRRVFLFTKEDITSPYTSLQIFPDVVRNILSGIPEINDNTAIELAVYHALAISNSPEDANKLQMNDIQKFLPQTYKLKNKIFNKIKELISVNSSQFTQSQAAIKYILTARALNHWGCEIFTGSIDEKSDLDIKSAKKSKKKRKINISIGPFGIHLYDPSNQTDLAKIDYRNIASYTTIKDRIFLRVTEEGGTLHTITIISNNIVPLVKLFDSYKKYWLPSLEQRDMIQRSKNSSDMLEILERNKNNSVKMFIERQLDHPSPNSYQISKNLRPIELAKIALFDLTYPNRKLHLIMTTNHRRKKEKDNEYNWVEQDQILQDVNPVDNSYLFVIAIAPTIQVMTTINRVTELELEIRRDIFTHCKQLAGHFNLGTHLGYTLYEVLRGERRPLDFKYCIPLMTPNYVEVLLKRRFLLFSLDLLRNYQTLRSGYRDVKQMALSGIMTMAEEQAFQLAILSLYAESTQQSEVLNKVAEMNTYDLSKLLPLNIQVQQQTLRRFKAAANSVVPMLPINSMVRYIILANNLVGYGSETYKCYYTDIINVNKKARRECTISLSPYNITINGVQKQKQYCIIYWPKLNSYLRHEDTVELTFNDENGIYCDIEIESEEHSREIYSFINDLIELLNMPEFRDFPNFLDIALDDINEGYDDILNMLDRNALLNDTDVNPADSFDDLNTQYDDKLFNKKEDNIDWRLLSDALMYKRGDGLLDALLDQLNIMSDGLNTSDPNDLYGQLNFLHDQLKQYLDGCDDETKQIFLPLLDSLDSLRKRFQDIAGNDLDITPYIGEIRSKINELKAAIEPAKKKLELALSSLDIKLRNSFVSTDAGSVIPVRVSPLREDQCLANALLNISDLQEILVTQLQKNYPLYAKFLDNPNQLTKQLLMSSSTLTQIASNLLKANGNPEMMRKHLIPQLNDILKQLNAVGNVITKAKEKGINIPEIENLYHDLIGKIESLLKSDVLNNYKQDRTTQFYQFYPGDHRLLEKAIQILQNNVITSSQLMNDQQIASNKSITSYLRPKVEELDHDSQSLQIAFENLNIDALNDGNRTQAIEALQNTLQNYQLLEQQFSKMSNVPLGLTSFIQKLQQDVPELTKILYSLSTVNITPQNVQRVSDDLTTIWNRYASLPPEIILKLTDNQRTSLGHSVGKIKDVLNTIDKILPNFMNNPTSGQCVYSAQQSILKVHDLLPEIHSFVNQLSDITNDPTYPVLYERLITNVKSTLSEQPLSEEFSHLNHLKKFQQLQGETARVLNLMAISSENPYIKINKELHEKLEFQATQLKTNYLTQVQTRDELHERPFANENILSAVNVVNKLQQIVERIQPTSRKVSDLTNNLQLEQMTNHLLTSAIDALNAIRKAKCEPFRRLPTQNMVNALEKALDGFQQSLQELEKLPEISQNENLKSIFGKYITLNDEIDKELRAMATKPNMNLYKLASKLEKELIQITPTLSQVQAFKANKKHQDRLNELSNVLGETLQEIIPTFEDCKNLIRNYVPILNECSNVFKGHLNNPKVKQNQIASTILNDWVDNAITSYNVLMEHLNDPKYGIQHATEDKNIMLKLLDKYAQIPPDLRQCLTPKEIEDLAKLLGRLAESAHNAINGIRQLPGLKRPKSDPSQFAKIEAIEELSESIPKLGKQIESLRQFYKELVDTNTLYDRPNALKLTTEIEQQLGLVKIDQFKPDADENQLMKTLSDLKEKMNFVISSSELISPIIHDPYIGRNTRIVNDNINTILHILENPHLNLNTSKEFVDTVLPMLKKIQPQSHEFIKRQDVLSNQALLDYSKTLDTTIDKSIVILPESIDKPRKLQMTLDELYQSTSLLIPLLQENPDHESYLQAVNKLFDLLNDYTSLQKVEIRYSDAIKLKKPILSDKQVKELADQTFSAFESRNNEVEPELFENLTDNLGFINDHQEQVPVYISHAALLITPSMQTHELVRLSDSLRTVISCSSEGLANDLYEKLAVKTSVRAALQLIQLEKSLEFLEQRVEQFSNMFDDETKFYLAKLQNAIKRSDTSLILQCQSLPTAVFNYQPLHNIDDSLQLLLKKVSNIAAIKPIVQPLQDCGKDFSDWVFQTDLSMMAYFQNHIDDIVSKTEDLISKDKSHKLPAALSGFVRQAVSNLKFKERGISYDMPTIKQLSNLIINYQSDLYPQILKALPESDDTKQLQNHIQALEKIKPIIKYWQSPIQNLTNQGLRSNVISSLCTSIKSTNNIKNTNENNPEEIPLDFALGSAKISSLLQNLTDAIDKNIPVKEVHEKSIKSSELAKSIIDSKNPSQTKIDIESLINCLTQSEELINKVIPIDYNSIDEIDKISDLESLFSMISDKEALNLVKEAAKYLEKLIASIPKLSNEQRSSDTNKFNTKLDIKLSNGKTMQLPKHSLHSSNIDQSLNDPIISVDPKEYDELLNKLEDLIYLTDEPTTDKQNSTIAQIERTMLSQRISQLQQQQISEFPDVVKNISSINSKVLPITNITSDQASSSINSIQQQFEALQSSSELHKLQSRLSPDQILSQQLLLTHNLTQAIDRNVDLPIQSHVEQTNAIQQQLFKSIMDKLQTGNLPNTSIKSDDLSASIQRGYSQLALINELITIQQQLSVNIPDLFKFVQSPEGLQLLSSPITPHQLLEQQQNILKQVNLVSSPELLNAFQKNLLPEQIIIQQRILQHSLKLLTGEFGQSLMSSESGKDDVSKTAIFASLNSLQQEIIKENPEVLKLNYYVNPSDILEAQQFSYDLLNRLTCMQKISDIQQKQLTTNKNAAQIIPKLNQPTNSNILNARQISMQSKSLITQFNDPTKILQLTQQLSAQELLEQQQILSAIKSILTNPELLNKYCPGINKSIDLNSKMNQLFNQLQDQQNNLLRKTTKPLDGIKPLIDSQIMNGYEKTNSKLTNLNRIEQVKTLLKTFNTITPDLSKQILTAKPTFSSEQLETTRAILERLIELSSSNLSNVTDLINNLTKDDQKRVYSLLVKEVSKLNKFDPYIAELLQKQSRIFDMAAIIQRQPGIGIVSVSTKDLPQIEKADQIEKKVKSLQENIIVKGVQNKLIKLMEARNDLNPMLASITDEDKNNALKNITANDVPKFSSSLIQQVKVLNDNSKLNNILEHTNKDQLIVEQVMLQQIITDESKESKDAKLNGIKLVNVTNSLQTTIIKSTEQAIEHQKPTLVSSIQVLTPIKPLTNTKIKTASKLSDEQFARTCLTEKLENIKLKQLKGIKGLDEFVHNTSTYETATSDPFTQDEVIDYQDMLKSLITIDAKAEDVLQTYQKQTKETNTRGLTVLTNLTDTITPKDINIVTELEKDNLTDELKSFFDKSINYDDLIIGQVMDVKIPSEKQNASRVASAYQGLITIVPTMYNIPSEEVKSILIAENKEALNIVNQIYDSKSTSYSNQIRKLVEIAPQLVASYSRVSSSLKPQVKSQLKLNPLNIMSSIEALQNASCVKSTQETASNFRKLLADLYSTFQNIDSAIVENKDENPISSTVNCFASMAKAIQNQDIDLMNKEIIQFKGLNIHSLSFGTNDSYLKAMEPKINKILPLVEKSYAIHGKISPELLKSLTELRTDLITIINKETKNPYELIEKLKTATDVQKVISNSMQKIGVSTKNLIESVQNRNKSSKTQAIAEIIEYVSNSIAAIFQGLNVTSCENDSIYNDCIRIFDSSLISVRSMIDILKTSAVSSTSIRRSTRSFNRMFDSMLDIMEDTNIPIYKQKPTSDIGKSKLEFMRIASDVIKSLSSTITARAESKIPETFEIMFNSQVEKLEKSMKELETKSTKLLQLNTDKQAEKEFNNLFVTIKEQFGQFKANAKNPTLNKQDSALFDLTHDFINLSDSFGGLTRVINKLTDAVPIVPDLENAEKLKKRYVMPSVPKDTANLKVIDSVKKLNEYINIYQQKSKAFYGLFPNAKNAQLADSMNEVYTAIDNVVLQTLRVSAISMNLELQSGLATTCSNIAVNYDSLLKELRSRFMLSGDWDGQSPKYRENIKNAIEETQKIAQKALEIAEEEAKAQNAVNAKFTNVLNPLTQVKSSLETYNDKVKTMKSSISREYATNMLGIGITLCDSVNHVVLHAKAHPSSEESVDSYLSLTEEVTEQMKLLLDASTKITSQEKKVEEPETLVIDRMKGLNGIGEKFAKPHNNESPEAKALREGVVVICKGANALANSAETALNNKREQRKKQEEAAKKGGAVVRVGTTKESLLKRLELESRVIRARIILEKSEKNLAELG